MYSSRSRWSAGRRNSASPQRAALPALAWLAIAFSLLAVAHATAQPKGVHTHELRSVTRMPMSDDHMLAGGLHGAIASFACTHTAHACTAESLKVKPSWVVQAA